MDEWLGEWVAVSSTPPMRDKLRMNGAPGFFLERGAEVMVRCAIAKN
jgi:hypothetical protein